MTANPLTLAETVRRAHGLGATVAWVDGLPPHSPLRPYLVDGAVILIPTSSDADRADLRDLLACAIAEFTRR